MWEGNKQTALWVNESIGEDAQRRGAPDPGARRHLLAAGPLGHNKATWC